MGKHLSDAARAALKKGREAAAKLRSLRRGVKWGIVGTVACVAAIIIFSNWAYIVSQTEAFFNPDGDNVIPPPPATFSAAWKDTFNPTVVMDDRDATVVLHEHIEGLPTTSTANWDTSALVSDLSDLSPAVFAASALDGHDDWWITISASVANTVHTYDDNWGDRTYGARDYHVDEDGANMFPLYVTPSGGAGFTIKNLNTGAAITTANITAGLNFSVTQFLNNGSVGAYDQAYVGYTSYIGHVVDVNVLMTFTNATGGVSAAMEIGDLVGSNMAATGGAGTAVLDFHTSMLGQAPITTNFIWGDDAVAAAAARIVSPNSVGIVQRFDTTAI